MLYIAGLYRKAVWPNKSLQVMPMAVMAAAYAPATPAIVIPEHVAFGKIGLVTPNGHKPRKQITPSDQERMLSQRDKSFDCD